MGRYVRVVAGGLCGFVLALSGAALAKADEGGSIEARLARASVTVDGIRRSLSYAVEQRESAQSDKDVIRLNCVSDKLAGIRGLLKIAEQSQLGAGEASRSGDGELLDHHLTKISIAAMQVDSFRVEVEGCVGEASKYTGDTVVTVEIDSEIRSDNPAIEADVDVFPPVGFEIPEAISGSE